MAGRIVNDTVTFIPYSVFVESTPPSARMCVLKELNTTFPNLFTPHQKPDPAADTALPNININLFRKFLLALKLPGISPEPVIATGPTEPITEELFVMCRE